MQNNFPIYKIISGTMTLLGLIGVLFIISQYIEVGNEEEVYRSYSSLTMPMITFSAIMIAGILSWFYWKVMRWLWMIAIIGLVLLTSLDTLRYIKSEFNNGDINEVVQSMLGIVALLIGFGGLILIILNKNTAKESTHQEEYSNEDILDQP